MHLEHVIPESKKIIKDSQVMSKGLKSEEAPPVKVGTIEASIIITAKD